MDEADQIIKKIYDLHYVQKFEFEEIGILLRSIKLSHNFINKLKYLSQKFCAGKSKELNQEITIPFKYSIQKPTLGAAVIFINRCFEYYFWIHKTNPQKRNCLKT